MLRKAFLNELSPRQHLFETLRVGAGNQRGQYPVLCDALHRALHGFIFQHFERVVRERMQLGKGELQDLQDLLRILFKRGWFSGFFL